MTLCLALSNFFFYVITVTRTVPDNLVHQSQCNLSVSVNHSSFSATDLRTWKSTDCDSSLRLFLLASVVGLGQLAIRTFKKKKKTFLYSLPRKFFFILILKFTFYLFYFLFFKIFLKYKHILIYFQQKKLDKLFLNYVFLLVH